VILRFGLLIPAICFRNHLPHPPPPSVNDTCLTRICLLRSGSHQPICTCPFSLTNGMTNRGLDLFLIGSNVFSFLFGTPSTRPWFSLCMSTFVQYTMLPTTQTSWNKGISAIGPQGFCKPILPLKLKRDDIDSDFFICSISIISPFLERLSCPHTDS
jgi:hypothetical protein